MTRIHLVDLNAEIDTRSAEFIRSTNRSRTNCDQHLGPGPSHRRFWPRWALCQILLFRPDASTNFLAIRSNSAQSFFSKIDDEISDDPIPTAGQPAFRKSATFSTVTPPVGTNLK